VPKEAGAGDLVADEGAVTVKFLISRKQNFIISKTFPLYA
jgi:hypothetical protein